MYNGDSYFDKYAGRKRWDSSGGGYALGADLASLAAGGPSSLGGAFEPTEQVSKNEPWGPQQEYLKNLFTESQRLYNQGGQLYPDFSQQTKDYLGMLQQRAGGTPLEYQGMGTLSGLMAGNPYLQATQAGAYLGQNNPYLNQQFQSGAQDITDWYNRATQGTQNQFGSAGMTGPSSFQIQRQGELQRGLGRGLSDLYTGIYSPAYESERSRMLQASGLLGSQQLGAAGQVLPYSQQGIQNLGLLGQAGQAYDVLAQQRAREPWERLGMYQGGVTGNYGGTLTQPGPSPFERGLGYASTALGGYGALA